MGKLVAIIDAEELETSTDFEVLHHPVIAYPISFAHSIECDEVIVLSSNEQHIEAATTYGAIITSRESLENLIDVESSVIELDPAVVYFNASHVIASIQSGEDFQIVGNALGGREFIALRYYGLSNTYFTVDSSRSKSELSPLSFQIRDKMTCEMMEAVIKNQKIDYRPIIQNKPYAIERNVTEGKPKMLFSAPYDFFSEQLRSIIESNFDVIYAYNAPKSEVLSLLPEVEIWFVSTSPPYFMGQDMFDAAIRLKVVATPSTGTNHLDSKHAESKGIEVLSIKQSPIIDSIYASSEFSFTLLLAMVKKLELALSVGSSGVWREKEVAMRSIELQGKTIGLIGFGRIGKKMASFSQSFQMNILAYDPNIDEYPAHVSFTDLNNLLEKSDIVCLHYHLTDDTKESFGQEHFDRMKNGAYFLNTARGELVDEEALISSLESGKIKAAAVDVISNEHEREKWDHKMIKYAREHDNLLLSPHIAGLTIDSESKAGEDLIGQVIDTWNQMNE